MNQYFSNETASLVITTVSFFLLLVIVFFLYKFLFLLLKKRLFKNPGKYDYIIIDLFKLPALWLIYWVLLKIFIHLFLRSLPLYPYIVHFNKLLLVFSITWIVLQVIQTGAYLLQRKLDIGVSDNLKARKSLTQINIFKGISNTIIIIIAIAVALLTFSQAKAIGLSILTSAGILGIIVGFAAQKSIGMILAGIQIAITQPIRLDDVVIIEGEWGRIEEITLTYVVVRIWDDRHLIVPVTWFLEKTFENWTRENADITGTIFLYVDYSFPVESIRTTLPELLKENPNWDGRIVNVQVTKASEQYKEIRVLVSSSDASKNWDLRTDIREKLIDFINENYPNAFAKTRIEVKQN